MITEGMETVANMLADDRKLAVDVTKDKSALVENGNLVDPLTVKLNVLQRAFETAITVLRVDEIILSQPSKGLQAPKRPPGHWDE